MMRDGDVFRHLPHILGALARTEREVGNFTATVAKEMGVVFEVRAVTRGAALVGDDLHKAAIGECFETVIDRSQRDIRNLTTHFGENLDGCRVIALAHEHIIDGTTLPGHPQSMTVDGVVGRMLMLSERCHGQAHSIQGDTLSRTIPI